MITSVMGVLFAGFTGALLAQGLIGITKATIKKSKEELDTALDSLLLGILAGLLSYGLIAF